MRPTPTTVAVLGTSGYAGQVLSALLDQHPSFRRVEVEARGVRPDAVSKAAKCEAVCLALPIEAAKEWVAALKLAARRLPRIIDLSGAHREAATTDPTIHYGQPELFGPPPAGTQIVANPGCYPTAALLSLRPLVQSGLVEPAVAVVGASGATGAGKSLADHLHFCNLSENVFPYAVGTHRHRPEIATYLGLGVGENPVDHPATVSFVTQLLPVMRGLSTTSFVQPKEGVSPQDLAHALARAYVDHRWVTVLDEPGQGLGIRHVVGSHQALLAVGPSADGGLVPVFASIDNLMRGAASQAVHNLNLWFGLYAGTGLPVPLDAPVGVPVASAPGVVRAIA